MLKLLGAALVTGCFTAFGLVLVRRLDMRVRLLGELLAALRVMRDEIGFGHLPLPELLARLEADYPALSPLWTRCLTEWNPWQGKNLASCWADGLEELELRVQEKQLLAEAGRILGRYDAQRQAEGLGGIAARLEFCWNGARDERARRGRVLGGVGAICGLAVVILLL